MKQAFTVSLSYRAHMWLAFADPAVCDVFVFINKTHIFDFGAEIPIDQDSSPLVRDQDVPGTDVTVEDSRLFVSNLVGYPVR